jgi:hypothetical protein
MGRERGTSMARGSLQLEAKATVKLGSFPGRASLDLTLDTLRPIVGFIVKTPISPRKPPGFTVD